MTVQRSVRPWDEFLSETEREVIRRGRYAIERPLGSHPCLVVVDAQQRVVGRDCKILEQIDEYPSGVGQEAWQAVKLLSPFVDDFRSAGFPVVYTKLTAADLQGRSMYGNRIERTWDSRDDEGGDIVDVLTPSEGDLVIEKVHASSFFGTPLESYLVANGIDSILIAGGSTSGCVRATAVDAATLGYKIAVLGDCTFDRIALSHAASLLDIWMKYGAVWTCEQGRLYLRRLVAQREEQRR